MRFQILQQSVIRSSGFFPSMPRILKRDMQIPLFWTTQLSNALLRSPIFLIKLRAYRLVNEKLCQTSQGRSQNLPSHLPERVLLLWKYFKILSGKLGGRQCLETEVGPALNKFDQAFKSVEPQPVIPIIGQMCHEDADLQTGKKTREFVSTRVYHSTVSICVLHGLMKKPLKCIRKKHPIIKIIWQPWFHFKTAGHQVIWKPHWIPRQHQPRLTCSQTDEWQLSESLVVLPKPSVTSSSCLP